MGSFDKLKEQLELQEWPNVFLFKFIVENTPEKIALTTALFSEAADISFHNSKNGKFVSISAKELMLDVNSIISIYEKSTQIEGLISL